MHNLVRRNTSQSIQKCFPHTSHAYLPLSLNPLTSGLPLPACFPFADGNGVKHAKHAFDSPARDHGTSTQFPQEGRGDDTTAQDASTGISVSRHPGHSAGSCIPSSRIAHTHNPPLVSLE